MAKYDILLIEDSEDDATLTMMALSSKLNSGIKWIDNGMDALDYLFSEGAYEGQNSMEKPKLILLDLKLPKMSGIDILERLKARADTRSIPVVVMTSSRQESDLKRCYELGTNSYVVKPIEFDSFAQVTQQISVYWLLVNERPQS